MSNFAGIERRIRQECDAYAKGEAEKLLMDVAAKLGHSKPSFFYMDDVFKNALAPFRSLAIKRFTEMKMAEVWGDAEKAALDVLKRGVQ